jgi:hypothetical protein
MKRHLTVVTHRFSLSKLWAIATLTVVLAAAPARAEVSAADAKSGIIECTDAVLKDHNPGLARLY